MREEENPETATPATRTGVGTTGQPIAAAQSLGRYQILSVAGTGGMGRVYSAFDPQLDRRIALKVVHGSGSDALQRRAAREAKALARVSHPNVVAVHEVNEHEGNLLIAMEFVHGRTLKSWMLEHPPSNTQAWVLEALDVLLQAGRGLAAAHAVDLVHRDFKPSNVLVGDDGRVRVVDFGLARDIMLPAGLDETGDSAASGSSEQVTKTGAVVGTPAYMAPEQSAGGLLDGRTDQYAFCVAAWEVLFGLRPREGEIERPEASAVPLGVEKALRKGMSKGPGGRFAGMDTLLERLAAERDGLLGRKTRSTGWWLLAATLGVGGTWAWMSQDGDPCVDAGEPLAEVWGVRQSEALRSVFLDSGLPYAENSWGRVESAVGRYVTDWTEAARGACRASQQERPLPTTAGTLGCLAQRRRALTAYLEVVGEGTPEALDKAALSAEGLPEVSLCQEADFVLSGFETPTGDAAADVAEVREVLARSAALRAAGQYRRAKELVEAQKERVEAVDFPPLSQDFALERASIPSTDVEDLEEDERLLLEAYVGASGSGRTAVAVEAASRLAVSLADRGEVEAGARWLQLAEGGGGELGAAARADLLGRRGEVLESSGDFEGAVDAHSRRVQAEESRLGEDAAALAVPLTSLGGALHSAGRFAESETTLDRALMLARKLGPKHPTVGNVLYARLRLALILRDEKGAQSLVGEALPIIRATYGDGHPITAHALVGAGTVALELGDTERALKLSEDADAILEHAGEFQRLERSYALMSVAAALGRLGRRDEAAERSELAHSIRRSVLPELHPDVALSLHNLASAKADQGRFEEALELYRRERDLMVRALGPIHPDLALAEGNLGATLMTLKRYSEAARVIASQFERIEAGYGENHPRLAQPLYNLGLCAEETERFSEAEEFYHDSVALLENEGQKNPMLSFPLIGLARVAVADDRPADAVPFAERALLLSEEIAILRADAQAVLAKALWSSKNKRARARELADAAMGTYLELGAAADDNRGNLDAWRAKHGL